MIFDGRRRWPVILALLVIGALLSRFWLRGPDHSVLLPQASLTPSMRPFDLMVQLGLMVVCALGIRALLPGDDEIEGDEDARGE